MKGYTKQQTLDKIRAALQDPATLYQQDCINWKGKTVDTKEFYFDIIAGYLLEHIDELEIDDAFTVITRRKSYDMEHDGKIINLDSYRREEQIATLMKGKEYAFLGKVLDYQIPLKDKRGDYAGKIDIISVQGETFRIIELKKPDSNETLLRCVLEVYTYYRTVNLDKLLDDFNCDCNEIVPTVMVCCSSLQIAEYLDDVVSIRELMRKLGIEVVCYTVLADGITLDDVLIPQFLK